MSANPQVLAQLLSAQGSGQAPQQGGIQTQVSPIGAAAQLAQKIMLMQALQKPPQQQAPQIPGLPPNPTTLGAPGMPGQALPQGLNQAPMPGAING